MTQAWVSERPSGDGVLIFTGSLGLAQEFAWSSSSACVSYCCHEMPDKQCQGREMDNTFGAQFGCVCVPAHHGGESTAAGGSEAVGACRCLLTPQQIREMNAGT